MAKPWDDRRKDLPRPALEAIIDHDRPLARLAREIESVVVGTTVQPKAIAHPAGARLCDREAGRSGATQRCATATELSASG